MPGAQIPTSVTRLESMLGYQAVSLTEFDTSALSSIAAGSKVEIAGAFFTFSVDEAIEASTWTAITTGNTAYIALVPAGVAGSQTVTARFTATAPVWSTSKQGWYASAGSSTRVIGSVYKAEATAQYNKGILQPFHETAMAGRFEQKGGISIAGSIHGNVSTGFVYTTLNPYITLVGQGMLLTGAFGLAASFGLSKAVKISSTEIALYGFTGGPAFTTYICTAGGVTNTNFSIAW
jgi:hypothetical protein